MLAIGSTRLVKKVLKKYNEKLCAAKYFIVCLRSPKFQIW